MIREVSGPAVKCRTPAEIAAGGDAVENKKDADKPARPARPMFDGDVIDKKGVQVPVVVRQVPGGQIAPRHDEGNSDQERNEQAAEAVAEEEAGPLPVQGRKDEDAADQEHQRHKKDVIKILEDVEAEGAGRIDDRMGGSDVYLGIEVGESSIGKRGMMRDDEHGNKSTKVVEPVGTA